MLRVLYHNLKRKPDDAVRILLCAALTFKVVEVRKGVRVQGNESDTRESNSDS